MRRRPPLLPLLLPSLLVISCGDHAGPADLLVPASPAGIIQDADNGGRNPHARWLAPISNDVVVANFGAFDATVTTARLHVVCVESNDPGVFDGGIGCSAAASHWQDPANAIDSYGTAEGALRVEQDHYHAQVELGHLSLTEGDRGTVYRLVATVQPYAQFEPVVVAFADFRVLPNGRAKSALNEDEIGLIGSKLPARIRLDQGVKAEAAGDAIDDVIGGGDPTDLPLPLQQALAAFDQEAPQITVVEHGSPETATYVEDDGSTVTAAFRFDGDELQQGDVVAFAIGEVRDASGEDVCGDAFGFEKSGCKRALAVSLTSPSVESTVTSGYAFQNDVAFCIATGIPPEDQDKPWQLVKIDAYQGQDPRYETLGQDAGACDLVSDPAPPSTDPISEPIGWLRQHVGRPLLDFLVPPLYAGHSTDKMGSTLRDLSDLTAALITEMEFVAPPTSAIVGSPVPVTVAAHYTEATATGEPDGTHLHPAAPAAGVPVTFSIDPQVGRLMDPATEATDSDGSLTLTTDQDGLATVLWTLTTPAGNTLTVTPSGGADTLHMILTATSSTAPVLFTPAAGAVVPQNNAAELCDTHPARGSGFRVAFDWGDVDGAAGYEIEASVDEAALPFVEVTTTVSDYVSLSCGAIISTAGSSWRVRVVSPDTGAWSAAVPFSFGPCLLADGSTCYVPSLQSVTVEPGQATITPAETVTLTATTLDQRRVPYSDGYTLRWTSSNPQVATVSVEGVVTGVSPGTVQITATVDPQFGTTMSAPATITVLAPGD